MKSFYVFSAGCIRRGLDTIHVQRYLVSNGWHLTTNIRSAELIVVATCGVVRLNEVNSLNAIARAIRKKDRAARVVVIGCLPVINPEAIRSLGEVILVPTGHLQDLDAIIGVVTRFADVDPPDSITDNPDIVNYLVARSFCRRNRVYRWLFHRLGMNRAFIDASVRLARAAGAVEAFVTRTTRPRIVPYFNIKIAEGCMSECSYCATRFATGTLKSRPLQVVVDEFRRGLSKGYRVFQLISEDTGCYGLDIGSSLGNLINAICSIDGEYQLVIIDCCPQWLVDRRTTIVPAMVRHQDRIKELFVPLQSGADPVLQRMRRSYQAAEVRAVLEEIRDRAPGIALRTGVMVGFPGETDEDFAATKRLAASVGFAEVTVNRYEDRPGTESSSMPDKVSQDVIEERACVLARDLKCRILS